MVVYIENSKETTKQSLRPSSSLSSCPTNPSSWDSSPKTGYEVGTATPVLTPFLVTFGTIRVETAQTWESHLISLSLSFLIGKKGPIPLIRVLLRSL